MIFKVCGVREGDNIAAIDAMGVDLMGFIFYPRSPRYVEHKPSSLPHQAQRVGVFVDEALDNIVEIGRSYSLDYIQLHGAESVQFCRSVKDAGFKLIKAFSVDEGFNFEAIAPYCSVCDLFVFDTKCSGYGGSGEQFDWSLLEKYRGSTPFLLSGGIGPKSANSLREFTHPMLAGYDLNSRFEREPGVKDAKLLANFLEQLKK